MLVPFTKFNAEAKLGISSYDKVDVSMLLKDLRNYQGGDTSKIANVKALETYLEDNKKTLNITQVREALDTLSNPDVKGMTTITLSKESLAQMEKDRRGCFN